MWSEIDQKRQPPKREVILRYLRTARIVLCHDFCMEMVGILCCDSLKLQLLTQTDQLRRRAYLLPKENCVFDLYQPVSGENTSAAYNEDAKQQPKKENQLFLSKID